MANTECKCNLIIDSCCDLPAELVCDIDGVDLIHFPYIMSDGEHADDMFQSIPAHNFYELMRKGEAPSTAQVPVTVFQEHFTQAIESGVPTVYLSFTSGLSGSFDTATLVRNQLVEEHPGAELYVVDTHLASIAEGLFVYEAMRQRRHGLTAQELVEWAEEARFYVNEMFMVDDLNSLKRGGRIPSGVAFAGTKLDVKPILDINLDGKLSLVGVARGRKKGIRQLAEFYKKRTVDGDFAHDQKIIVGCSDCQGDANRLKDEIVKINDAAMFLDASIGPVIGSHVGPGMLAISFWGPDSRDDLSVADRIAKKVRQK